MSNFHQNIRKCLFLRYVCESMKSFKSFNYDYFSISRYPKEIPNIVAPTPDKNPISREVLAKKASNLQRICKIK